jgi:hypothetical protein
MVALSVQGPASAVNCGGRGLLRQKRARTKTKDGGSMNRRTAGLLVILLLAWGSALGQKQIVLERRDATVVVEPYAPNIVRITMSLKKDAALAGPGYGIIGKPSEAGWTYEHTDAMDTYRSDRMTVKMPVPHYGTGAPPPGCDT